MRLKDRVAIITGGSKGIGRGIAEAFANEGAEVVLVSRHKSDCDQAAEDIRKAGGIATGIQADISSEEDVARMVKETKSNFQHIDILVNNAAVNLPFTMIADLKLDDWNKVLGVNLTGTFLCSRAVLPEMIAQRSGTIINMASIGGRRGAAGRSPYRATKAAIINFTESLAAEVKQYGINVNAICPAQVATEMLRMVRGGNLPPTVTPVEEMAALAVFLASDESNSVTGTAIDAFGAGNPLFNQETWLRPK